MSQKSGPTKHFFAHDNVAFEGMLYRYKIPSIDRRVWGWLVRHCWGIRNRDRYQVDREKVAKALAVHPKSIDKALQSLKDNEAIIQHAPPRRGRPAIYGPNKRAEAWKYPLEPGMERPVRCAKTTHLNGAKGCAESTHSSAKEPTHQMEPDRLTHCHQTDSPNSAANPDGERAGSPPKTQILNTDHETHTREGVCARSFSKGQEKLRGWLFREIRKFFYPNESLDVVTDRVTVHVDRYVRSFPESLQEAADAFKHETISIIGKDTIHPTATILNRATNRLRAAGIYPIDQEAS